MRKIVGLLLVMFLMVSFAGQPVFASPEFSNDRGIVREGARKPKGLKAIPYGVEHARISKAAEDFVNTSIDEIMETLVLDPEFYDASDRDLDELFLPLSGRSDFSRLADALWPACACESVSRKHR